MNKQRYLAATFVAAAVISLSGCGGSGDKSADKTPATPDTSMSLSSSSGPAHSSSAPAGQTAMLTISNFAFSGASSVSPGQTVMVMNDDAQTHSVTADSGNAFDVTVEAGASATFTAPMKPGTYPYHCTFHSDMHGTLTVK
jgi:plastocyanin